MAQSVLSGSRFSLAVRMIQIQNGNIGRLECSLDLRIVLRNHHLPRTLAGDRPHLSLLISSSASLPSKYRPLLFTLTSELALLLTARGESETLIVLFRPGPDLTLYIEDAGIFVINGRKLPGMLRLISCSRGNSNQKNDFENEKEQILSPQSSVNIAPIRINIQ